MLRPQRFVLCRRWALIRIETQRTGRGVPPKGGEERLPRASCAPPPAGDEWLRPAPPDPVSAMLSFSYSLRFYDLGRRCENKIEPSGCRAACLPEDTLPVQRCEAAAHRERRAGSHRLLTPNGMIFLPCGSMYQQRPFLCAPKQQFLQKRTMNFVRFCRRAFLDAWIEISYG